MRVEQVILEVVDQYTPPFYQIIQMSSDKFKFTNKFLFQLGNDTQLQFFNKKKSRDLVASYNYATIHSKVLRDEVKRVMMNVCGKSEQNKN